MKTLKFLRVLALAVLTLTMALVANTPTMAQWVRVTNGQIPANALRAGNEADGTPLYIARGNYEGGLHPGKVRANALEAYIPYGGREIAVRDYEVYVGTGTWQEVRSGQRVPTTAIAGGREANGSLLYIARASIEGGIHPGKSNGGEAWIPYGGQERYASPFQVLVSPAGGPTSGRTAFNPAVHGFKFANNFTVQTQIAGFNGPTFSGLCGGMAYAALDYYHARMTIPQQNYMPAEGLPLQSYLYNRQLNSALPNADKWAEYGLNPFGSRNREFFNWGLQLGGGRLGELKSKIDRGEPVPLGLQACGGDCGCPGGCPGSHQVLAIGYDMGRYTGDLGANIEDVSIFIYDPNHPNQTMTLKPNVAGAMYSYLEAPEIRWRAYFTDMKYSRSTPPVIPNNPTELIATFHTGGDDLRGGNDNVHLVLLMRSGTTIRFDNVNNMKRWVDNSTQTVSRPLPATFRTEDVVGVRLETTFGGWNSDNWNLDELTITVRLNGADRQLIYRNGTPLFRFTGDQKVQEFRF